MAQPRRQPRRPTPPLSVPAPPPRQDPPGWGVVVAVVPWVVCVLGLVLSVAATVAVVRWLL